MLNRGLAILCIVFKTSPLPSIWSCSAQWAQIQEIKFQETKNNYITKDNYCSDVENAVLRTAPDKVL